MEISFFNHLEGKGIEHCGRKAVGKALYFWKFGRVDGEYDCFVRVKERVVRLLAVGYGAVSMFLDVADDLATSVFEAIDNIFVYERPLRRVESDVEWCIRNGVWIGKIKAGCPVDFWPIYTFSSNSIKPEW